MVGVFGVWNRLVGLRVYPLARHGRGDVLRPAHTLYEPRGRRRKAHRAALRFGVWGLGFSVESLRFRFWGLAFRV